MARRPTTIEDTLRPAFEGIGGIELDMPSEGADIEIEDAGPAMLDGAEFTEMDDGGVEIDFEPQEDLPEEAAFDANLALYMDDMDMNALGEMLLSGVEEDRQSRGDWEATMTEGIKLMGLKIEERTMPFKGACGVYDPLMAEAVIRWQAVACGELLPANGPVKTQVIGVANEQLDAQASRVQQFMNLYLTELAPEFYEEFDQMLFWLPLVGSTFKKTYQDRLLGRPVSRFVLPDNFIASYGTTDLATSPRFCHITSMTRRNFRLAQLAKVYRDVDVGDPQDDGSEQTPIQAQVDGVQGVEPGAEGTEEYKIYEVYADLNLSGFENDDGIPLPYIVTIEEGARKVLSIYRNYDEADPTFQRKDLFTHYKFMPGVGFYGLGYAHLLGNSAKTATSIRRQLIDAGTLNNFPGGLRVKGMRLDDNNIGIGPTEFREIDTGGLPIQNAIMTMPYKEPSQVSLQLLQETYEGARNLANTAEIAVGEGRQDAPVGTTVALMEAATRLQSATLKRCHRAFSRELKLIAGLFGKYLPDEPYPFPVRGGMAAIMREDFSNNIDVIPVSDPNISSSAQRMMRAEALLRFATQQPDQHNLREAYRQMYVEMGVPDEKIELLLAPERAKPMPLDPLTENQNAIVGMPLIAGAYQDHDAHIAAHAPIAQDNPALQAHINEHLALKMRQQVEQMIGQPLPPPGMPMPPEMENQIAVMVAKAMQQLAPSYKPQPEVDQMAQVEMQKLQLRDADSRRDAEVEIAKAQMEAQTDAANRTSREKIAAMKLQSEAMRNIGGFQ
ncbi:MAG: portal protein [Arenimonas sp.]